MELAPVQAVASAQSSESAVIQAQVSVFLRAEAGKACAHPKD